MYTQSPIPPLSTLLRKIFIYLGALYLLELVSRNFVGLPVDGFIWRAGDPGDLLSVLTRYLIQGNDPFHVLLSGLMLLFFFPTFRKFSPRDQSQILISLLVGGTLVAAALDFLGLVSGVSYGWGNLTIGLVALFGLRDPNATVSLFMVLPIRASFFVWGTGAATLFYLLASPSLMNAERFGIFVGVVTWWYLLGPGARERLLRAKGRQIEDKLSHLSLVKPDWH